MKCPNCKHAIEFKTFLNISMRTVCPHCSKRLAFFPSMIPSILLWIVISLFYRLLLPFTDGAFNRMLSFIILLPSFIGVSWLLLRLNMGKIIVLKDKDEKKEE